MDSILIFTIIFLPLIAAFVIHIFLGKEKTKSAAAWSVIVVSAVELVLVIALIVTCYSSGVTADKIITIAGTAGLGLNFTYSGFGVIFAVLTALAWLVTFMFAKDYMDKDKLVVRYDFFNLITLSATFGIFFAADFFTLFVFFEVMSFASFMWVAHRQTKEALYAAGTYLGIAVAGGLAILMGIFLVYDELGTVMFNQLLEFGRPLTDKTKLYIAAGCMFAGFGAKAGAFPLHVWLPESYTQAPVPATALLSAILSKTGIYGLLLVSSSIFGHDAYWGLFLMIVGIITMVLGGIKGVLSSNLKTTIAYSSMSQIGFIIFGIAMQNIIGQLFNNMTQMSTQMFEIQQEAFQMAAGGTILHMVNHSLVKLVLFLVAGTVFMNSGSYDLNRVRGFGRNKPFLNVCFIAGAAGVGGIPLLNGYISKTLLHESIVEYQEMIAEGFAGIDGFAGTILADGSFFKVMEYLFLFAGGLTIAYMTKLYIVLFVEKNPDEMVQKSYNYKKNYLSPLGKVSIGLCALPIPFIGIIPHFTADKLMKAGIELTDKGNNGFQIVPHYFALSNLAGALISIVVGAAVYLVIVRALMLRRQDSSKKYKTYCDPWPVWLDMEKYIYRAVFYKAIPFVICVFSRILDSITDWLVILLRRTVYKERPLPHEWPEGNWMTRLFGALMEHGQKIYCIFKGKKYEKQQYAHKAALQQAELVEDMRIIERSLSFGLFMFCVGLGLTMMYLLIIN